MSSPDPDLTALAAAPLPTVALLALGGTIASTPVVAGPGGRPGDGVTPQVGAAELVAAVPELATTAHLEVTQVRQVPSSEITLGDLVGLVPRMAAAVEGGAAGVVLTQGTDTLEESAFALDLLWQRPEPVVVTGALRAASAPGADGPAHLLAATQLAASPLARDAGVLVCLGDEVHAARHVRKTHTSSPAAFTSPGRGPVGWLSEGRPVLGSPPRRMEALEVRPGSPLPPVVVVRVGIDEDPRLFEALVDLGHAGVVVEALGGGHVPSRLLPALDALVTRVPVLLASRTGAGRVLERTYGYPGGDVDLVARGLVPVGTLDAAKARVLLTLALASGLDRAAVEELVRQVGG